MLGRMETGANRGRVAGFGRRGITILLVAVVGGGVLLGILIPLGTGGPFGRPALQASPIEPSRPAPATQGRDADGALVVLPSPEGRPAIVTFLSADCPDPCPVLAARISGALDEAGDSARQIDVVAISLDPEGDTPPAVTDLLVRYDLQGRLRYLVGTRAELEPVWEAWQVAPEAVAAESPGAGEAAASRSAPVILVNEHGRQVAQYPPGVPFEAADLASDIRALT